MSPSLALILLIVFNSLLGILVVFDRPWLYIPFFVYCFISGWTLASFEGS